MSGSSETTSGDESAAGEGRTLAYETPGIGERRGVLFVEDGVVVVRDGTQLPLLCIFCGEEGVQRSIELTFTWDASFQVTRKRSSLELRRSGTIRGHLCRGHYRQWAAGRIVGVGGMILSGLVMAAGGVVAAISDSSDVPRWTGEGIGVLVAGFAMMILFLFVFALRTRVMSCRRIEEGFLFLDGAGEGFLRAVAGNEEANAIGPDARKL